MRSEEHKDEVMDEVVGRGIPRDRAGNRLGGWPIWGIGRLGVLSVLLISRKTDGGVQPMDCRRRCLRTESGVNQVEREDLNQAMSRLAEGDRSAFEDVYAATWPILNRFTRRTLPHSADADDVAQEALLKLFGRASEFDVSRDALAWALGIAACASPKHRTLPDPSRVAGQGVRHPVHRSRRSRRQRGPGIFQRRIDLVSLCSGQRRE